MTELRLSKMRYCWTQRTPLARVGRKGFRHMNKFESPRSSEAVLRYLDGDYEIVRHGAYVACAVTGAPIPLDELKYWSVSRQEPYATGLISFERELEVNPELRSRKKP